MVKQSATIARYGAALRMYDNMGKTLDRYTILPPRWAGPDYRERDGRWCAIACNAAPFHGIGMHTAAAPGPHLGKRVAWSTLPPDVQRFARQEWPEFAPS